MLERIQALLSSLLPVRMKGKDNHIVRKSRLGRNFRIRVYGDNNSITIGSGCTLTNTSILMTGNGSRIVVEDDVRFLGPCKIILGGGSTLIVRRNAGVRGVEFNLNGAKIEVGELCMFSYGIVLRNHDSHRVINPATREVMNAPRDIVLGKHVWVAQNATILKGCRIGDDSIIGFGSIVTKGCASGSILAGNPAKVVKENINWDY